MRAIIRFTLDSFHFFSLFFWTVKKSFFANITIPINAKLMIFLLFIKFYKTVFAKIFVLSFLRAFVTVFKI